MAVTRMPRPLGKVFTKTHSLVHKLTKGRIGGSIAGRQFVSLTTTGHKSARDHEVIVIVLDHPNGWVATAANGGHDAHPDWYHNLQADPSARMRVGDTTHAVMAREIDGSERNEWWDKLIEVHTEYAEFEKVADRQIPVLLFARG